MRVRSYREVLDAWDCTRTATALARVARRLPSRSRIAEGLSPHAPYTTSRALLAAAARIAVRRRIPVTMHWSETEAELEWLERGTGPLAAMLPASPRATALDLYAEAGLLGPTTSLVHGNHPRADEPARLARSGVTLVHCPGSHEFFGRAEFRIEIYRAAGVRVALGTDSAASNADLDMRRELRLLRRACPAVAPEDAWRMATVDAAHALGWGTELGALARGARADFVAFDVRAGTVREALEALTTLSPPVRGVWIGGRRAWPSHAPASASE